MVYDDIVLTPGGESRDYWRNLWRYRDLLYVLVWRDVAVRYKQTAIGISWVLLRPGLTMLVFIAFRHLVGMPSGGIPEPLLVFAAVVPWQFFSAATSEASASLIGNANLISKVYFPRMLIPCAAVLTALVDLLLMLGMLALILVFYELYPSWHIVALPFFIALTFSLSLGIGLLFAGLNVEYRDFRYIVPFVVQLGIFISPIAFTTETVPQRWRLLYGLNPMVGIIDGFRWSVIGAPALNVHVTILSLIISIASLFLGLLFFRRLERAFADVI